MMGISQAGFPEVGSRDNNGTIGEVSARVHPQPYVLRMDPKVPCERGLRVPTLFVLILGPGLITAISVLSHR
jgi:hypothetical protein